jgi:RHS repeat-associated protein
VTLSKDDTDAIGSVRMITDSTGQVVARYDYRPFGDPCGSLCGTPSAPDKRQFAGKERDQEIGLDYVGARYYASQIGRFTTVDPGHAGFDVVNPQSWNGYSYALNNPLRFVDPLGTEPCQITLRGADAAAAGVADGGTVEGECVRPKESWSDWFGRNILGQIPFTATLQAPGLGEADQPVPDRSPDLGVSIAAAVVMPRVFSAKATTLAKMMQSEAGVAEVVGGGGKVIAGVGSKVPIRDVARLVRQYGGKAEEWVKVSSTTPGLQTHAYRNIVTGVVVELKSKIPGF